MAQDTDEVRVGSDGVVSSGPLTAAAPTNASADLVADFVDLGYISEDGVTESNSQDTEPIRAWQRNKIVRTLITEGTTTFQFVMIQTSAETLAEYYGGTVDPVTGSIVTSMNVERPRRSYVLDVLDGDNIIRKYIPEGQVTEVGDIVYRNGEPIGYEVTITAHENSELGGSVQHWFSALAGAAS